MSKFRVVFSFRFESIFAVCIVLCATPASPWMPPFGQCPSILISNKLENARKTIFLSTLGISSASMRNVLPVHHARLTISKRRTKEHHRPWGERRNTFCTTRWRSVRRKQSPKNWFSLFVLAMFDYCRFHQDSISQTYGASRKYNR